jgi:Secretion system C-terminal sorting domain
MKKYVKTLRFQLFALGILFSALSHGQGTWVPVNTPCPGYADGVSLLLTDGSVMVKIDSGGEDTVEKMWVKLTPDAHGSYANGTWTVMHDMNKTRLFCSSQMLKDGRLYMAGGEYGTGDRNGEIYDPLTDTWTLAGPLPLFSILLPQLQILDGNSVLLPDGRVLQNCVLPTSIDNVIYNPVTDSYSLAPSCLGGADEAAWLKMPDNSVLFIDIYSKQSERYIPALNTWRRDDSLPVLLYDVFGYELGAGFVLPDSRAFFLGSTPHTAYYTPSGDTTNGTWTAGPDIPNNRGAVDAAAAMMPNGKILCALSQQAVHDTEFLNPAWFYEFDYRTNTFTEVSACNGDDSMNIRCSMVGMLDLPDGNILVSAQNSNQYYIYQPGGTPVASGIPAINNITMINCDTFMATGTLFNGISQGAAYGDDWQMPTNYPIIRLENNDSVLGSMVHYARTFNWNSTGLMRGSQADTTYFTLPAGLPYNTYNLVVVANGIASAPVSFTPCNTASVPQVNQNDDKIFNVFPNPASGKATVVFSSVKGGTYDLKLVNMLGQNVVRQGGKTTTGLTTKELNLQGVAAGIYSVVLQKDNSVYTAKLTVQ